VHMFGGIDGNDSAEAIDLDLERVATLRAQV